MRAKKYRTDVEADLFRRPDGVCVLTRLIKFSAKGNDRLRECREAISISCVESTEWPSPGISEIVSTLFNGSMSFIPLTCDDIDFRCRESNDTLPPSSSVVKPEPPADSSVSRPCCFGSWYMKKPINACKYVGQLSRRNRHFGTLANEILHLIAGPQNMRILNPPIHKRAWRMIACGEAARTRRLINEMESSCSSAGRRLVVVRL